MTRQSVLLLRAKRHRFPIIRLELPIEFGGFPEVFDGSIDVAKTGISRAKVVVDPR